MMNCLIHVRSQLETVADANKKLLLLSTLEILS